MREDGEKGAGLDGRAEAQDFIKEVWGCLRNCQCCFVSCEFVGLFCVGNEYAASW